jgi:hypothetical protein
MPKPGTFLEGESLFLYNPGIHMIRPGKHMWKIILFLLCLDILSISSACNTIQATVFPAQPIIEDQTQVDLSTTATEGIKATTPSQESTPLTEDINLPFQTIREYIAQVLEIPLDEVVLISHEPVDWPDSCLGAPRPDEMCLEVITPGWEVVFNTTAGMIRARLDKSGRFFRTVPPLRFDGSTKPSPHLPTSGIEGLVLIGPACPGPVKVDQPCPHEPYQATIRVLGEDGTPVTQFISGADGRFKILLPPGIYILDPQSPGAYPRAGDQTIVVQDRLLSQIEILYDSGMR